MFVEAATCLGDSGQKSVLDHTTAHIDQRLAPPKREESSEKHSSNATPSAQIRLGVVKHMLLVNGLNTNIAACVLCDHRPTLTQTACFVEAAFFFFTANWFKCKDRNWWVCFLVQCRRSWYFCSVRHHMVNEARFSRLNFPPADHAPRVE